MLLWTSHFYSLLFTIDYRSTKRPIIFAFQHLNADTVTILEDIFAYASCETRPIWTKLDRWPGKSESVEFTAESLQWLRLAARKICNKYFR